MKIFFLLQIFFFGILQAQTFRLDSSLNVRNSENSFINTDDVVGHISIGTEFEIVNTKILGSGSKSVEIKVKKLGKGSNLNTNTTDSLFIYQNKNTAFKQVFNSLQTESGVPCADGTCNQSAAQQQMQQQHVVQTSQNIVSALENQNSVPVQSDMEQKIKRYSESSEVAKTVKWAFQANKNRLKGVGACYRRVKEALATKCDFSSKTKIQCTNVLKPEGGKSGPGNNLIEKRFDDNKAADAVKTLPQHGFINLLDEVGYKNLTPETAPKGAVLVYQSLIACNKSRLKDFKNGCGHVEIKLGDGSDTQGKKYVSDYVNDAPITSGGTGHLYKLVGVMIKPNL